MAASISPETRDLVVGDRYRLLRELGSRAVPTYAAHLELPGGKKQLVVVERVVRGGPIRDDEAADFVRDAKRVAELEHPNLTRIRDVSIRADDVIVACDFVDGERLSEIWQLGRDAQAKLPLEVTLRILIDILTGLGALHNLRDVKRQPLKLLHGEVTPANVVVGLDGTSRVLHVCRVRSAAARPGRAGSGYLAPEILLADGTADQHADVYSVGVMLWEALAGAPLFSDSNPHAIVAHLLSGKIKRAVCPPDAPWAADLTSVAERALAADPQKRFGTAAELAAEIRRVAGPKLATTGRVANFVKGAFGEKIMARRARIEDTKASPGAPRARQPSEPTVPALPIAKAEVSRSSKEAAVASALMNATIPLKATPAAPPVAAPAAEEAPPASANEGWDVAMDDEAETRPPEPLPPIPRVPPQPKLAEPRTEPVAFVIPAAAIPPAPLPVAKAPPVPRAKSSPAIAVQPIVAVAPQVAMPPPVATRPPAPVPVYVPPPARPPMSTAPMPMMVAPPPIQVVTPEHVPTPTPSPAPPAPRALASATTANVPPSALPHPMAPDQPLAEPRRRRTWPIVVAVLVPCVVLVFWGGCALLQKGDATTVATATTTSPIPPPRPTTTERASPGATADPAPSTTAKSGPLLTAQTTAPATTKADPPAPLTTARPQPTYAQPLNAVPAPTSKARPHPTYDPQGI